MVEQEHSSRDALSTPLGEIFPWELRQAVYRAFLSPDCTPKYYIDELQKLHSTPCGFPHEDTSTNPSERTCQERFGEGHRLSRYNVTCPHSHTKGVFRQAQFLGELLGYEDETNALFGEFQYTYCDIEQADTSGRVLFKIANQIPVPLDTIEWSLSRLQNLGIATDVQPGMNREVQSRFKRYQEECGTKILAIRDRFVALLMRASSSIQNPSSTCVHPLPQPPAQGLLVVPPAA